MNSKDEICVSRKPLNICKPNHFILINGLARSMNVKVCKRLHGPLGFVETPKKLETTVPLWYSQKLNNVGWKEGRDEAYRGTQSY